MELISYYSWETHDTIYCIMFVYILVSLLKMLSSSEAWPELYFCLTPLCLRITEDKENTISFDILGGRLSPLLHMNALNLLWLLVPLSSFFISLSLCSSTSPLSKIKSRWKCSFNFGEEYMLSLIRNRCLPCCKPPSYVVKYHRLQS